MQSSEHIVSGGYITMPDVSAHPIHIELCATDGGEVKCVIQAYVIENQSILLVQT
jgi:hypothetical protein